MSLTFRRPNVRVRRLGAALAVCVVAGAAGAADAFAASDPAAALGTGDVAVAAVESAVEPVDEAVQAAVDPVVETATATAAPVVEAIDEAAASATEMVEETVATIEPVIETVVPLPGPAESPSPPAQDHQQPPVATHVVDEPTPAPPIGPEPPPEAIEPAGEHGGSGVVGEQPAGAMRAPVATTAVDPTPVVAPGPLAAARYPAGSPALSWVMTPEHEPRQPDLPLTSEVPPTSAFVPVGILLGALAALLAAFALAPPGLLGRLPPSEALVPSPVPSSLLERPG